MKAIQPLLLLAACLSPLSLAAADNISKKADENGLITWTLKDGALALDLVQRLPDQTRAFFIARGFPTEVADQIATACVFQIVGKNISQGASGKDVRINLADWRIVSGTKPIPIKLKERWAAQWPDNVPEKARIAFRWATFPTDQVYHPADDYNWGMASLGPPPGSELDLEVVWHENGQRRAQVIKGIVCPTHQD